MSSVSGYCLLSKKIARGHQCISIGMLLTDDVAVLVAM